MVKKRKIVYDISKLCYGGIKVIKAILKDVALIVITIAAQVGMNALNHKENDWFYIILIGMLIGVVDFVVSFFKDRLESVNYTIPGLTKGTIQKPMNFKKPNYSKKDNIRNRG